METPFSITNYTQELIQDRQAKSVGDVLQNDPAVRIARGFGNFQEVVLHPRLPAELRRRRLQRPVQPAAAPVHRDRAVRAGRGAARRHRLPIGAAPAAAASAGRSTSCPSARPTKPLNRGDARRRQRRPRSAPPPTSRAASGPTRAPASASTSPRRDGDTGVDDEKARLGLVVARPRLAQPRRPRLGRHRLPGQQAQAHPHQRHAGRRADPLGARTPTRNFAQPWILLERAGHLRHTARRVGHQRRCHCLGAPTACAAARRPTSSPTSTVTDAAPATAAPRASTTRARTRSTPAKSACAASCAPARSATRWVVSAADVSNSRGRNAYVWDFFDTLATNLGHAVRAGHDQPPFSTGAFVGGELDDPRLTGRTTPTSVAARRHAVVLDDRCC